MQAGITQKHITFHCARHTAATLLLNNNISLSVVGKILGHKHEKTTEIYAKVMNKTIDKAMDVFDTL